MSGAPRSSAPGNAGATSDTVVPFRGHAIAFNPMRAADLPEVEATERVVYAHPWTLGNFQDSISSGYECWIARDAAGALTGYFLLMLAPDEAHLLNITVVPALQGRGLGRRLLDEACLIARRHVAAAVLLEVRPSNPHALAVYRHVGFRQIGIRKGYYPDAGERREDAIVMRLDL
jgi:ribosomal-protein-alanine N-acetyltransferase